MKILEYAHSIISLFKPPCSGGPHTHTRFRVRGMGKVREMRGGEGDIRGWGVWVGKRGKVPPALSLGEVERRDGKVALSSPLASPIAFHDVPAKPFFLQGNKATRATPNVRIGNTHTHPYADKHAGKANGVGDPDPEGMGHWTPYLSGKFRSIISILSAQHTTTQPGPAPIIGSGTFTGVMKLCAGF